MIINITKIQAISLYFDNTTALMSFLNPNLLVCKMNYKLRDLGLTLIDKFNKEQSRLTNLQFLVQKKRFLYLCTHKSK